jgi:voltage-gated sodium channel
MINFIRQIIGAKLFHPFIMAVIVFAGVVAGLETSPAIMAEHGALLHGLDRLILGVFLVEALLKLSAHNRSRGHISPTAGTCSVS